MVYYRCWARHGRGLRQGCARRRQRGGGVAMRTIVDEQPHSIAGADRPISVSIAGPGRALAVAALGFFVVTLDALVVNVALPAIGRELGGGITGLQWVVDGYTLHAPSND